VFLGEGIEEKLILSPIDEIAKKCWEEIPEHLSNIVLDEYVRMPNHVHGFIIIEVPGFLLLKQGIARSKCTLYIFAGFITGFPARYFFQGSQ
jgi:hypothetical protein